MGSPSDCKLNRGMSMAKYAFWSLALFFLVLTPFIFAFDCNSLSSESRDICNQIQNSNLSLEEKGSLMSNLDYNQTFYPDYNYVYQRNVNLDIGAASVGIANYNGLFVRDAWLSIFSIMPSVLYNGSLYCPDNASVLSGFNYRIEIPADYSSSGYPSTSEGDCRRIYSLTENTSENKIYVNNNYQGSGRLVNVTLNSDSEIKAIYDILVSVNIDHYSWNSYCCSFDNGYCVSYCHDCVYSYGEVKQDNIEMIDTMNVTHYTSNLTADLQAIDSYSSTTKLRLNYSNSIELSFENSSYEFYQFAYGIAYSREPYYVYTLKAEDYNQESINNMLNDGTNLLLKNTDNCSIKAFDFFNSLEKKCNPEYNSTDFYVTTDKLSYKAGEIIQVKIHPSTISANIAYDNDIKQAVNTTSFIAKSLKNRITASYGNLQAERIIYVADEDRFAILYNLSLFGLLNYFLYGFARKLRGVL